MRENSGSALQTSATRTVYYFRDKVNRAAGQRSGCHGFCWRHLDNFTVTRQPSSTYQDLVPLKQITVTRYFQPLTGIGKNHATATQTATKLNRRAVMFKISSIILR